MKNFDWTDLLHITQMWDLLMYRTIPYTGYDEFWLDRPLTYHPDVRFIEVQIYSIYWIWRILTGQACYISSRCEIYWCTELCCTLDMTNFDWTDLFHTTQMWDLLRYRSIPYTGYDEFWLDRIVTYHPDLWFIEVQIYSIHWIWRVLTGQTCYISPRCEIYWGTELFCTLDIRILTGQTCYILARCDIYWGTKLFHILDMTNFEWTDLLQRTHLWDLFKYRSNPYTGNDEFWLDRPVTYHPDLRFIGAQIYSIHWIWRILTGQTCYIPPRREIYLATHLIHTLDMKNFDWTDLLHITQMWDLLMYRTMLYTGYDEFWLDRPLPYHPDVRFIEVQIYSIHWIWRIFTGQACYISSRCEIYWCTELCCTLDMTNFDWTDLFHTTQMWDLLRYRSIPYTGYDEFWLYRPVTYHPDLWFIEVQIYSIHWIWRILTGQTCYIPPRCDLLRYST